MLRSTAIVILASMGLIVNQLPAIWLSYKTINSRYATMFCVNPDTDCNGTCAAKRSFIESRMTSEEPSGRIPSSVVVDVDELSPYTVEQLSPLITASIQFVQLSHQHTSTLAHSYPPPQPPPRV